MTFYHEVPNTIGLISIYICVVVSFLNLHKCSWLQRSLPLVNSMFTECVLVDAQWASPQ